MEVILPAILFKKFGVPQEMICLIILLLKRGLQNRRMAFLRKKGINAMTAQRNIPEQVAKAAAQMPHFSMPRKKNSKPALNMDMDMFITMLPRTPECTELQNPRMFHQRPSAKSAKALLQKGLHQSKPLCLQSLDKSM